MIDLMSTAQALDFSSRGFEPAVQELGVGVVAFENADLPQNDLRLIDRSRELGEPARAFSG